MNNDGRRSSERQASGPAEQEQAADAGSLGLRAEQVLKMKFGLSQMAALRSKRFPGPNMV